MNTKLQKLRQEQSNELLSLKQQLDICTQTLSCVVKKLDKDYTLEEYIKKVYKFSKEKETINKRIEYLETELLEHKYANNYMYSDVDPYEVIEECTENCYIIRPMIAIETEQSKNDRQKSFVPGGFIGHTDNSVQKWDIVSDENASTFKIRRHKDGKWYDANGSKYYISNHPVKFYDYNF